MTWIPGFLIERNDDQSRAVAKRCLTAPAVAVALTARLAVPTSRETADDKSLHFWSVPTDDGPVYIGIIDCPREGGGILEVGLEADYPPGFTAFRERIRDAMSHCKDGGLVTRYVSTKGGAIACDRGKATVNGAPFGLKHYPAIESPFARSRWDQGVMEFSINGKLLLLDARDLARPIRREQVAVNDWR